MVDKNNHRTIYICTCKYIMLYGWSTSIPIVDLGRVFSENGGCVHTKRQREWWWIIRCSGTKENGLKMKLISVPNYCSFQLSPPGCAPGRSSISNGTRDWCQWCPRSPCPEGAEGGELEPWHPLQARQGKNRSCSLIHWWWPKHPWTAWCCWKWHAVASFFVTTYCNSFMHKNTLCHSKSAHLASKRSSLLLFLSMCPIYTKKYIEN